MLKFQGFKISSRSKSIQKSIMLKKAINIFKALYRGKLIYFKKLNISKRSIENNYGGFYIHPNFISTFSDSRYSKNLFISHLPLEYTR